MANRFRQQSVSSDMNNPGSPGRLSANGEICHSDVNKRLIVQHEICQFSCTMCEKRYKYKDGLRRHIQIHHELVKDDPVSDEITDKPKSVEIMKDSKCKTRADSSVNKTSDTDLTNSEPTSEIQAPKPVSTEFSCSMCENRYKYKYSLGRHIRIHHKPVKDKPVADETTDVYESRNTDDMDLTNGIISDESTEFFESSGTSQKKTKCVEITQVSRNKTSADSSENNTNGTDLTNSKPTSEVQAPKPFSERSNDFECSKCGKVCPNLASLSTHKKFCDQTFKCDKCSYEFQRQKELAVHTRRVHEVGTPVPCEKCGRTLKNERRLRLHVQAMHSDKFKHNCPFCKKGFLGKDSLDIHVRRHTGERPFLCSTCGKKFLSEWAMKEHVSMSHSDDSLFICEVCGLTFKVRSRLSTHLHSHKEHNFPCELCGKNNKSKHHLQLHLLVHTQEKQFSCNYCGRAFTRKDNCKKHIRIHTNEKPYSCKVCDKRFNNASNRNTHMKAHLVK